MDENEVLVGELRRYLSSVKQELPAQESESTKQLKRDLNLAARVGQQLLMQLQSVEKSKEACELEIARLKAHNQQLQTDNQRLAVDQEMLAASIEEQDAEIAALVAQLQASREKSERMARAAAGARALESEVEMLTQLHADLRKELETSELQRDEAAAIARRLTANASRRLRPAYDELAADFPLLRPLNSTPQKKWLKPRATLEADSSLPSLIDDTQISDTQDSQITDSQLTDSQLTDSHLESQMTDVSLNSPGETLGEWLSRPQLKRSLSHESIFSVHPIERPLLRPVKFDVVSASQALASDSKPLGEQISPRLSARDKLSSIRGVPDRRRWFFLH